MFNCQDNINFWEKRAKDNEGWEMTSNDPILRHLEVQLINRLLDQHSTKESIIIDLGCGDGYVERNVKRVSFKEWHAIDPTKGLIEKAIPVDKVTFHLGTSDLIKRLPSPDIIFTVRTLINIPDQLQEYRKIAKACDSKTKIFFCEASIQGLIKINSARKFFKLPIIKPIQFNKYVDEEEIKQVFNIENIEHFSSSYYFGSRIVNALINPEKQNYNDLANMVFKDIKPFGEWGVHRLYSLRKK
jgi:hypothetical protein